MADRPPLARGQPLHYMKKENVTVKTSVEKISSHNGLVVFVSALPLFLCFGGWFTAIIGIGLSLFLFWRLLFCKKIRLSDDDVLLLFGLCGSGKTLHLTKLVGEQKHKGRKVVSNAIYSHCDYVDGVVEKADLGVYDIGAGTMLAWDEGSADGFNNRDFKTNFKDKQMLSWFVRHRQYGNPIAFTCQGWERLDSLIREDLQNKLYYCYKSRLFRGCFAVKLIRQVGIRDGAVYVGYRSPSALERLLLRDAVVFASFRRYGKHYKSVAPTPLPALDEKNNDQKKGD